jgi:hypothetical protein
LLSDHRSREKENAVRFGEYTLKNLEVKLAFNGNVPCSITGTGLIGPSFRETGGGVVRSRRRFAFRAEVCGRLGCLLKIADAGLPARIQNFSQALTAKTRRRKEVSI